MRAKRVRMVALLLVTGCLTPPGQSPNAVNSTTTQAASIQRAKTALARCLRANDSDDHLAAREAVESVLDESHRLSAEIRAELLDCRARAAFADHTGDASELCEAAVRAWERVPTQPVRLARALNNYGRSLALINVDLRLAEAQYTRVVALVAQKQAGVSELANALFLLSDLLDQECRSDEADTVLTRLEQVYRDAPEQVGPYPGVTQRFRALLARRRGKMAQATAMLRELLQQIDRTKAETTYYDSLWSLLAEYEREDGHYEEALRAFERGIPSVPKPDPQDILELAFAYEAAGDLRLAEHERAHALLHASAGKQLFPSPLPAVEPCRAEATEAPVGWLPRAWGPTEDIIEACMKEAKSQPVAGAHLRVLMRVEDGKVTAAGVRGQTLEPELLQCVADRVLGLEFPKPHDFNFYESFYTTH